MTLAGTLVLVVMIIFIINFILIFRRHLTKNYLEQSKLQNRFQQELLTAQIEIREQTLISISQEIHDNIGQALSLVKLNLNTIPLVDNQVLNTKVRDSKELIASVMSDLRDLVRSLHGDKIKELGLQGAVISLLEMIGNAGQFVVQHSVKGEVFPVDNQKGVIIYRIIQEALNNAMKYADCRVLSVMIEYSPVLFSVSVRDDGNGFNPLELMADQTGIGLKSMRNRAKLIGASLDIETSPGNGVRISVTLPKADIISSA